MWKRHIHIFSENKFSNHDIWRRKNIKSSNKKDNFFGRGWTCFLFQVSSPLPSKCHIWIPELIQPCQLFHGQLFHGHLLHGQKFPWQIYPGQLLPKPLPRNIQSNTKIRSVVPETWLFGHMLPGQMSPGQMLHGQMLDGQLLPAQLMIVQIFTGFYDRGFLVVLI